MIVVDWAAGRSNVQYLSKTVILISMPLRRPLAWKRYNVDGNFKLIRSHNYYDQVQQQLFTLKDRKHGDFIVCAIDNVNNRVVIVIERILPDKQHHHTVLPRLYTFWRLCWYTRRCNAPDVKPVVDAICFCCKLADNDVITCSNVECPYAQFHTSCCN